MFSLDGEGRFEAENNWGKVWGGNDAKVPTRYLLEKLQNQTQDRKQTTFLP